MTDHDCWDRARRARSDNDVWTLTTEVPGTVRPMNGKTERAWRGMGWVTPRPLLQYVQTRAGMGASKGCPSPCPSVLWVRVRHKSQISKVSSTARRRMVSDPVKHRHTRLQQERTGEDRGASRSDS